MRPFSQISPLRCVQSTISIAAAQTDTDSAQYEPIEPPRDTRDPPIKDDGSDTDSLESSRSSATALADNPTGGIARPEEDTSSKIQAIFFGIAGTCIGVASLAIALLTLRAMTRQRQSDPETPPPPGGEGRSGEMELAQHPSSTISEQTFELNATQPAENEQHERPATPANPLA